MRCKVCRRTPDEIEEYRELGGELETTPEEAVRMEEGTYNPDTGYFYCTECYIRIGMPLGTA